MSGGTAWIFVKDAIGTFTITRASQASAGLAYYVIFSLFPLLLLLISVGSFFLDHEQIYLKISQLVQQNIPNGEWRLAGQVGDEPAIATEIFQPLDPAARTFVQGRVGYSSRNFNLFDDQGNRYAEANATGLGLQVDGGLQFGTWGQAVLGYRYQSGTIEISTGPQTPDEDFETGQFFVLLVDDKLDNVYFPNKGHVGRAEYSVSRESFGSDTDFDQAMLGYFHTYSWGRNTLIGGVDVRTTVDGDAPIQSRYRQGGFQNLSGYEQDALTGQQLGLAKLTYLRRINDIQFFKAYLGARLEVGNVWENTGDISLDDTILAGSAFVGADTPIGPIYLGYGHAETGDHSLYLSLGPLFSFR